MKKLICASLALLITLVLAAAPVSAAGEYKNLLLLGDSITYGYNLDGGPASPDNYGMRLKQHLGIGDSGFKNAAVNGHTSADLLALLPSLGKEVAAADLIVVSIGGNDLLGILRDAVENISGTVGSFEDLLKEIIEGEYVNKLIEYITLDAILSAIAEYTSNLSAIVSQIRSQNPDAEVIFLAQYNPISGVPELRAINPLTELAVTFLNETTRAVLDERGATYLDVYTPFSGRGGELTFISSADIHPNAEGHKLIYELISEQLASVEAGAEPGASEVAGGMDHVEEGMEHVAGKEIPPADTEVGNIGLDTSGMENRVPKVVEGGSLFGCGCSALPAGLAAAVCLAGAALMRKARLGALRRRRVSAE